MESIIWGLIGVAVCFLWLFIKNYLKARKDPDVILASKLGMSMSVYRDCQDVYKEWYAWRWDRSKQKEMLKPDYKYNKFPKNPNAFHRYEVYINYLYAIKDWDSSDELTKELSYYNNPYEKGEYEWIRQQKIPIFYEMAE